LLYCTELILREKQAQGGRVYAWEMIKFIELICFIFRRKNMTSTKKLLAALAMTAFLATSAGAFAAETNATTDTTAAAPAKAEAAKTVHKKTKKHKKKKAKKKTEAAAPAPTDNNTTTPQPINK
jgi:hypothetical protein